MLAANIPGINVTGEATSNSSGAFEVVDVDTKKSYHSKLGGDGYLDDNKEKLTNVVNAIKADMPKA